MAFQRGEVILIPFPYTDLSAAKTRPAVVVSSHSYHSIRSELLLAYVSSQVSKADPQLDYVLSDWQEARLPRPSFVRPKVAAIEPALIVHQVGRLSARDMFEVDRRLRLAMALNETVLADIVEEVDFLRQPTDMVQAIAEKAVSAIVTLTDKHASGVNAERLKQILKI